MQIVLVDPSRTVLKFVAYLLEARGHDVRPFVDGCTALDYIKGCEQVDVLITSTEPLSMSGVELCWQTRVLVGCTRPIHILLMSSTYDQRHMVESLDAGADDFIGKPPNVEELFARLRMAARHLNSQRELVRLATIDPLTGVFNRRAFFEKATDAVARAGAVDALFCVMVDIDLFKQINDQYGHAAGDVALRGVAGKMIGEGAIIGRLGGEEFAILFERRSRSDAIEFAERLRRELAALQCETENGLLTLTCSLGISDWRPGDTVDHVLKRADAALYDAKTRGRNRVATAWAVRLVPVFETEPRKVRANAR